MTASTYTTSHPPKWADISLKLQRLVKPILVYTLLFILCAIIFLPLGWMLTISLKADHMPVFTIPPQWLPTTQWHWENFIKVLASSTTSFGRYTENTVLIVAWNIVGTLFSCSLVGYAFARLRFRGKKLLFNILILTMLIPIQALMIPLFLMFYKIGWYGTYLPLIVPSFFGNAYFIFLIRQYMMTFPRDLDDAAKIDGCNWFQAYWYIFLPLSIPVLTVVTVFVFLWSWNDLLNPLIYLDANSKFTVAVGLANIATRLNPAWNQLMAANLIFMLPALIIYFFAQDKLIGGIASVGIKG
jgi:ABC-type glycerol-3-phosphate transport system permease component